jgi:hypothetical protein
VLRAPAEAISSPLEKVQAIEGSSEGRGSGSADAQDSKQATAKEIQTIEDMYE